MSDFMGANGFDGGGSFWQGSGQGSYPVNGHYEPDYTSGLGAIEPLFPVGPATFEPGELEPGMSEQPVDDYRPFAPFFSSENEQVDHEPAENEPAAGAPADAWRAEQPPPAGAYLDPAPGEPAWTDEYGLSRAPAEPYPPVNDPPDNRAPSPERAALDELIRRLEAANAAPAHPANLPPRPLRLRQVSM